eukprot:CAMPEP_0203756672 /NCGR_PEP_ID=MMETSP0098-20131031/9906_1 /ASSEMBLY_ACC=CAM_ASM_000208 /TAXON_ID=96639 /ORGANISM=" , Strain NY0313808BC1" /LENGTH=1028 /DNA_ID=CAMNT_0050648633 /DNA_START=519 /DNA_END=3602 /DNA_ORIENTATION=-
MDFPDKIGKLRVYATASHVYVVGSTFPVSNKEGVRLLKFDKVLAASGKAFKDFVTQDEKVYSNDELSQLLSDIGLANQKTGGLNYITDAVALAGCVKFVKGYYLVLINNRVEEGKIDKHMVYSGKGNELVPLFNNVDTTNGEKVSLRKNAWSIFTGTQDPTSAMEDEFKGLFKLVDLSKSFYWSYTYDMSLSLQKNVSNKVLGASKSPNVGDGDIFVWNHYLAQPFVEAIETQGGDQRVHNCTWIVSLIHGSFRQQRCAVFSRSLTLTLIARRSRHFAGTRYLKRGVNDDGYVANDVEIEQIVQDDMMLPSHPLGLSSFVQVRGSIPTFWSQETSVATPKPPIKRNRFDPWYTSTKKHFADLMQRYGDSIFVLNLVKQVERHKRETIVGNDFKHAIMVLNGSLPNELGIEYRAIDFTRLSKTDPSSLLRALDSTARSAIASTSFFVAPLMTLHSHKYPKDLPEMLQAAERKAKHTSAWNGSGPSKFRRKRSSMNIILGNIVETAPPCKVPLRWSVRKDGFVPMRSQSMFRPAADSHDLPQDAQNNDDEPDENILHTIVESSSSSEGEDEVEVEVIDKEIELDQGDDVKMPKSSGKPKRDAEEGMPLEDDEDDKATTEDYRNLLKGNEQVFRAPRPSRAKMKNSNIQHGVIRTNCIDCLDRTNLAQFLIGLQVLTEQLISLKLIKPSDRIGTDSVISTILMEMYEELGDRISLQYGGSDAHRKGGKLMSHASSSSRQQAFYTSLKRFYSNAFTDHAKQDAINVFLGMYRPEHHKKNAEGEATEQTAELQGDFYLHNRAAGRNPSYIFQSDASKDDKWWVEPLERFVQKVIVPVLIVEDPRNLKIFCAENELPPSGHSLTSFDNMFSKPYFQPRDLVPNIPDDASDTSTSTSFSLPQSIRTTFFGHKKTPSAGLFSEYDYEDAGWMDVDSLPSLYNRKRGYMKQAPALEELSVKLDSTTRDPVNEEYVKCFEDPFGQLYEAPTLYNTTTREDPETLQNNSNSPNHWDRSEHQKEFVQSLSDVDVNVDDGW